MVWTGGPYSKNFPERAAARLVTEGHLRVDLDGSVWRLKKMRQGQAVPCPPKRIDHSAGGGYRQVKVTVAPKQVVSVTAGRLVWQVFKGDIPDRLTVNHKDGDPSNNALDNLELATHSDQHKHRYRVLKREPPTSRLNRLLRGLIKASTVALETGDLRPLREALYATKVNAPRRPSRPK